MPYIKKEFRDEFAPGLHLLHRMRAGSPYL
jgi:hypothetical protein